MLRVSKLTLYGWVHQRRVPVIRLGRILRFDPGELEAWWRTGGTAEAARELMGRRGLSTIATGGG